MNHGGRWSWGVCSVLLLYYVIFTISEGYGATGWTAVGTLAWLASAFLAFDEDFNEAVRS